MKRVIFIGTLLLSINVFAAEKPDILEDYKLIVGMIDDLYSDVEELKSKQGNLENTFGNIRVVKKETTPTSSTSIKIEQLDEQTRIKLTDNLR